MAATLLPTAVVRTSRPLHLMKVRRGVRVTRRRMVAVLMGRLLHKGEILRVVTSALTTNTAVARMVSPRPLVLMVRAVVAPLPAMVAVHEVMVRPRVRSTQAALICLARPATCRRTTTAAQTSR